MGIAIVVGFIIFLLCLSGHKKSSQTSEHDKVRHAQDGNGHVYYERDGAQIHEQDTCAHCMAARAEELQQQGFTVEHVRGKYTTGDLV